MSNKEEKTNFFLGLAVGVAVISTLGFGVLLADRFMGDKSSAKPAANNVANNNAAVPPAQQPPANEGDFSKVSPITDEDYIRGDVNAPITLIEYSDFECPFCAKLIPTVDQLLDEYDGQVRLVYRHFPLSSIHPNAQKAAEAAECAGEQGKFWEMHDLLFANQQALTVTNLKAYAGQLKLNQGQFDSCLDTSKYASKVNAQAQEAQAAGITGTPGTFVNDQLVKGAFPYTTFQQIVEGYLN
jgi:protein-disulfide isomerase